MEERNIGLRELREEAGKTISDVAKALGVSIQAVYHYEVGRRTINLYQVLILADLFEEPAEIVIKAQLNSGQLYREDNQRSHQKNHISCKSEKSAVP